SFSHGAFASVLVRKCSYYAKRSGISCEAYLPAHQDPEPRLLYALHQTYIPKPRNHCRQISGYRPNLSTPWETILQILKNHLSAADSAHCKLQKQKARGRCPAVSVFRRFPGSDLPPYEKWAEIRSSPFPLESF